MANDYLSQIAQMRQERAQREFNQELEHIQENYREAVQDRDAAAQAGDREEWDFADARCVDLEQAWAQRVPQDDPHKRRFMHLLGPWMEKNPQRATELLD